MMKAKITMKKMIDRLMGSLGYVPRPSNEETFQMKFEYLDSNGSVVFEYHPKLNLRRGDTVQIDFIPNMVISSDDDRLTNKGKEFICHFSEEWRTMVKKIFISIE